MLSLGGEGHAERLSFRAQPDPDPAALSPYDFGIFAIAFVLGGISLNYGNALVSVPAAVHMPRLKSPRRDEFPGRGVRLGRAGDLRRPDRDRRRGRPVVCGSVRARKRSRAARSSDCGCCAIMCACVMFARRAMVAVTLSDFSYSASGVALRRGCCCGCCRTCRSSPACCGADASRMSWRSSSRCARSAAHPRQLAAAASGGAIARIWSDIAWSLFGTTTWTIQSQGMMFLVAAIAVPAAYAPIAAGACCSRRCARPSWPSSTCSARISSPRSRNGQLSPPERDDAIRSPP